MSTQSPNVLADLTTGDLLCSMLGGLLALAIVPVLVWVMASRQDPPAPPPSDGSDNFLPPH